MLEVIDHVSIKCEDVEKSLEYYKQMGFKVIKEDPFGDSGQKIYRLLGDNVRLDLSPALGGKPGVGHIAFLVDDLDKVYNDLKDKGLEFDKPPHFAKRSGRTTTSMKTGPDGFHIQLSAGLTEE